MSSILSLPELSGFVQDMVFGYTIIFLAIISIPMNPDMLHEFIDRWFLNKLSMIGIALIFIGIDMDIKMSADATPNEMLDDIGITVPTRGIEDMMPWFFMR